LRCPECGHENPAVNNFCGICGAAMQRTPGKPAAAPAPTTPAVPLRQPPRPVEPHAPTTISGPSVLGLGSEPPARNVDYLLHDEEDSHAGRRWGLRILGLIILAGLGWWAWQSGNLSAFVTWFKGGRSQPAQVAEVETPVSATPPVPASPGAGSATPPPSPAADSSPGHAADMQAAAPAAHPPDNAAAPDHSKAEPETPAEAGPVTEKPAPMVATAPPAKTKEDSKPPEAHVKKTSAPKPAVSTQAPTRPGATSTSLADDRQVALAERYLYGKGVAANCDRALGILRPAAEKGNAKARTQLGALYSTGHCVARDLPTAYRWFALALRVDHDNATVEQNLQMIWRQMSPAERQLAIKLTQ
jgi:hypothetical protein